MSIDNPVDPTTEANTSQATEGTEEPSGKAEVESSSNSEAAKWRARLRATEGERDQLTERLTGYQKAEAERLAGVQLSKASDIWIDGNTIADVLDDDGNVDGEKVEVIAAGVLQGRPGLGIPRRTLQPDHSQGSADKTADNGSAWSDLLKSGGKR